MKSKKKSDVKQKRAIKDVALKNKEYLISKYPFLAGQIFTRRELLDMGVIDTHALELGHSRREIHSISPSKESRYGHVYFLESAKEYNETYQQTIKKTKPVQVPLEVKPPVETNVEPDIAVVVDTKEDQEAADNLIRLFEANKGPELPFDFNHPVFYNSSKTEELSQIISFLESNSKIERVKQFVSSVQQDLTNKGSISNKQFGRVLEMYYEYAFETHTNLKVKFPALYVALQGIKSDRLNGAN